jgi:hypothetical protein
MTQGRGRMSASRESATASELSSDAGDREAAEG